MYTAASSLSLFLGIIRLISFLFYYYKPINLILVIKNEKK